MTTGRPRQAGHRLRGRAAAAVIVIVRFTSGNRFSETAERRAQKWVAASFFAAGSLAGFGVDSLIEIVAASVVVWQLRQRASATPGADSATPCYRPSRA